jgi:hypothetical protein
MLAGMLTPDSSTVEYKGWLDVLEDVAEGEPLVEPLTGYNKHQTFYSKSVVTREAEPLTEAAVKSFFAYVINKRLSATHS